LQGLVDGVGAEAVHHTFAGGPFWGGPALDPGWELHVWYASVLYIYYGGVSRLTIVVVEFGDLAEGVVLKVVR